MFKKPVRSVSTGVRRISYWVAAAGAALAISAPASANLSRTVCAAGNFVDANLPTAGSYWALQASQCQLKVSGTDAWSSTAAIYGNVSVPVEDMNGGTTLMNNFIGWFGGDGTSSSRPKICAVSYAIDKNGNVVASTSPPVCTTGAASHKFFNSTLWQMSVPEFGALVVNFAGQKGSGVDIVGIAGAFANMF
jgi:hypothetical protein